MTGSDAAFVTVYEDYYRQVYAYCRRRVSLDRVDDAVAEVFLVVWRRIADVPEGEATLSWLYSVAYRVLGHHYRGRKRRSQLEKKLTAIGVEPASSADEYLVRREELNQVIEALSRLRPQEQEILRLSLWEDLPHTEVASILEISIDAAKQRVSRARKSLAKEFVEIETKHSSPPAAQKGGAW